MVTARRAGFTLVEAIVALVLSSVLVVLVGTTFLVQNRYYAEQVERSAAQDNARMVTEMIASEIRSTMEGAVVAAENKRLVIRSPMAVAVICANGAGPKYSVYIEGGDTLLDVNEVGGVAMRDPGTGTWTYKDDDWSKLFKAGHAGGYCAVNGADTAGADAEFFDLIKLDKLFGGDPPAGSFVMLYRTVEYTFAPSLMDPTKMALFRRVGSGEAVEFATGMDASAQFMYRKSDKAGYTTSEGSKGLKKIDGIRVEARSRRSPQAGGADDVTYGWGVNVALRNGGG